MNKWNEMGDAPKDRAILLYGADGEVRIPWAVAYWDYNGWCCVYSEPLDFEPTHWTELPEPPNG